MEHQLIAGDMLAQLNRGVSKEDEANFRKAPRLAGWFMPNNEAGSANYTYTPDIQGVPRRYQTDIGTTFNLNALSPQKISREKAINQISDRWNGYETADPTMKGVYTDYLPDGSMYNEDDWDKEVASEIQSQYELDTIGFAPTLGSIINEDSPLFKSYPKLRDTVVNMKAPNEVEDALGLYKNFEGTGVADEIDVNPKGGKAHEGKVDWITTLKHEIQHNIDKLGNVPNAGASEEEFKDSISSNPLYKDFITAAKSGDNKAMNREANKLTPEQRSMLSPMVKYYNNPAESIARMTTVTEGLQNYDMSKLIKDQRFNNKLNSGVEAPIRNALGLDK